LSHHSHGLFERGAERFTHSLIFGIINYFVQDLLITLTSKSSHQDCHWDGISDSGNSAFNNLLRVALRVHSHLELERWLVRVVSLRANFSDPRMLGGRLLMKHQDDIGCHSLVGDDDLLTAVDNKVAALIKNALLCLLGDI